MRDNVVELERVTKRFGTTLAVDELDLAVPRGVVQGFIGPNGSGKTTTLRMILRMIHPDSGVARVLGDVRDDPCGARVGYLPEERGLYRKMKVGDVLRFHAELRSGEPQHREVAEWLERLGLEAWAGRKVETLSKGMAQKVQFIAAVVPRPDLLILDEPFSGLDPVNANVLRNAILELRSAGTTILFSTHDMAMAEVLCDAIFMIYRGRKVLDGTLSSIQERYGFDTVRVSTAGGAGVLEGMPEVARVVDLGRMQELQMVPGGDPQAVLKRLVSVTQVLRFEIARPSLHEIFVRIVGEETEVPHVA